MLSFKIDGREYQGFTHYTLAAHRAAEVYMIAVVFVEDSPDVWLLNAEPENRETALRELQRYYQDEMIGEYFDVCLWKDGLHFRCQLHEPLPASLNIDLADSSRL